MSGALRRAFAPIGAPFVGLAKMVTRSIAFFGKEIIEVIRRPGALVSLILGPFLIMALFGVGYSGYQRPLNTLMVVPSGSTIPRDADFYQKLGGSTLRIVGVTDNVEAARAQLERMQVDLVVVAPPDLRSAFQNGQQSVIHVEYNNSDPVRSAYTQLAAQRQVQDLNRVIIEQFVAQGESYVAPYLGSQIPPQVVAAPTKVETTNIAPLSPTITQYYAPAVLALVLQHMAITLTALSLVRERLGGALDLFRVAPVRTLEILVGKYLSYGFLNLAVGGLVTLLMVQFLGVPMLGRTSQFATVLALLTFASLGFGLLISTIADSERQAVQLSMLVLLASVFLSGFVLPLDQFTQPVQWVGYLLPVTYGIRLLQDTMLRGETTVIWQFWSLVGFGVALFFITAAALRRDLTAS